MSNSDKLPQIQAKIREVCPNDTYCPYGGMQGAEHFELHHVLRAIGKIGKLTADIAIDQDGHIFYPYWDDYVATWDLTKSLADQDDSVFDLLFTILCHE